MKKLLTIIFMSVILASPIWANHGRPQHSGYSHHGGHSNSHYSHSSFNINFGFGCYNYGGFNYIPAPRGYYITQYIKVWIPPRQMISIDEYGNRIVTVIPGYYELRPMKVWVNY